MNILAIDSSTSYCSVTLFNKARVFNQTKHIPRKHNEFILPMIDQLITTAGINKKDIDLLAYGVGPGSFVGVRLSAAIIQAMALMLDCPIIGFSSMQAIAINAYQHYQAPLISVLIDARIGDVYFGQYTWNDKKQIMDIQQEICLPISVLSKKIEQLSLGFVTGDIIKELELELNKVDYCPNTEFLLPLIQQNHKRAKLNNSLNQSVAPVYLQGTAQWKKING